MTTSETDSIATVAVLDDELRRGMYGFIRRARRPVGRDEAAAAVGISRKLAAFHLDKLVAAGLLQARFERVDGSRRAGRIPKVYEPTDGDVRVSIPQRQHDLLAAILVEAVSTEGEGGESETAREAAMRAAHDRGRALGTTERARTRPGRLGAQRALTRAEGVLADHGFEPARESPVCLRLLNCPFHPLAATSPELVCGINHAFLTGFLAGLRAPTVEAVLAPRAGECCVHLRQSTGGS
ncbi:MULTISPECIES: helix-turn-helix transcriptional regulator [Nocardiopsis]|uniref:Transcriptional regulator n=1 Tax=Nocardiopsis sinuspersici TaxID=501010 RepID=A0A1V3BYL4_9ACTN|nr:MULTISPECIES: transcriptional regulator [Nocardiopsis]NYH54794.1 putative ArsR family transcriptional regulator [Nocardiopsis sinuspersici]OOC53545.1 transcriptional regulator [Nocardiopsis sinuspersici]